MHRRVLTCVGLRKSGEGNMGRVLTALVTFITLLATPMAMARGGHSSHGAHHSSHSASGHHYHHSHSLGSTHHSSRALGVSRDSHGHIKRSAEAKAMFKRSHPCPSTANSSGTCPGYAIDHIRPLKRGGADAPSNMQWQTVEAAKLKDRTE